MRALSEAQHAALAAALGGAPLAWRWREDGALSVVSGEGRKRVFTPAELVALDKGAATPMGTGPEPTRDFAGTAPPHSPEQASDAAQGQADSLELVQEDEQRKAGARHEPEPERNRSAAPPQVRSTEAAQGSSESMLLPALRAGRAQAPDAGAPHAAATESGEPAKTPRKPRGPR